MHAFFAEKKTVESQYRSNIEFKKPLLFYENEGLQCEKILPHMVKETALQVDTFSFFFPPAK